MSLINDMLRDLDKRQAPDRSQQIDAQRYGALTRSDDSRNRRGVLILLGVIVLLLITLAVAWWYVQTRETQWNNVNSNMSNPVAEVQSDAAGARDLPASAVPVKVSRSTDESPEPNTDASSSVNVKPDTQTALVTVAEPGQSTHIADAQVMQEPETHNNISELAQDKKLQANLSKRKSRDSAVSMSAKANAPQASLVKPHKDTITASKPVATVTHNTPLSKVVVLTPEQQDQQAASAATKMLANGQTEKARTYLYQFIEAHDIDDQSRAVLVVELMKNDRMAEAGDLLTAANLADSSYLRRLKAQWLAVSGQPDQAIALLNTDLPEISTDAEYYVLLAALYQQQGYNAEAVERYSQLLRYDADVADWWVGMAISLDSSGQYPSALKAYQHALKITGLRAELAEFAKQRLALLGG